VIDTLKVASGRGRDTQTAQVKSSNDATGKSENKETQKVENNAQAQQKDWPKPSWPQSGTIGSDAVIDTLKVASGRGRDTQTAQVKSSNEASGKTENKETQKVQNNA
jgi:hypothetical protein